MLTKKLFMIFLIVVSKQTLCIHPASFCFLNAAAKHKHNGRNKVCHSYEHTYRCDEHICSSDKTSFQTYKDIEELLNLIMKSESKLKKFQIFNQNIQNCSAYEYKWKPEYMCVHRAQCLHQSGIVLNKKRIEITKKISCPCKGIYGYYCGKDHCAISQAACKEYFYNHKSNLILTFNFC